MKTPACDWAWMAEAGDDGRLTEPQHSRFDRHAAHCVVCAEQVRSVKSLRARFEAIPEPAVSDFQHHRRRQSLIARASYLHALSSEPRPRWRLFAFSAVTVGLIVVAAWGFGVRDPEVSVSAPRYEVTSLNDASWTNEEAGTTARVTLSHGSAAFHVHKLNAGQRFFVSLPDGEIEVRGTRFVVDIAEGHTKYVVVMEGKVAFREGGAGERLLLAGDRWDAPARTAAVTVSTGVVPAPPAAVPVASGESIHVAKAAGVRTTLRRAPSRAAVPGAAVAIAPTPVDEAPAPVVRAAPPATDASLNMFARGMSAFRAGRYAEAEGLWQQFAAERPQDPRIEDIAFLRAVVRARQGDVEGAAALARAYLERFPHGMRRKEAEALTRHASQ